MDTHEAQTHKKPAFISLFSEEREATVGSKRLCLAGCLRTNWAGVWESPLAKCLACRAFQAWLSSWWLFALYDLESQHPAPTVPTSACRKEGRKEMRSFHTWFAKLSSNVQTAGEFGWFCLLACFIFWQSLEKEVWCVYLNTKPPALQGDIGGWVFPQSVSRKKFPSRWGTLKVCPVQRQGQCNNCF